MALWRVAPSGLPVEGDRLHTCVEGRYVTVFRHRGALSAIDAICHHAGGPMTLGRMTDIEDLGVTVVACPWHKFMVSIDKGLKVYKGVDVVGGKPVPTGWKIGKTVQRCHEVYESDGMLLLRLDGNPEPCVSDNDACSERCAQEYPMFAEVPTLIAPPP